MIKLQHASLESGRWFKLSLIEQLANIGSEVIRTINWKNKGNKEYSRMAFERFLELIYLTVKDPKNIRHLREITRTRECLIDYFDGNNIYNSNDQIWQRYFYSFNYAARNKIMD